MKKKMIIEMAISELKDYDWLSFPKGDGDIEFVGDDNIPEAAKSLELSPLAVKAIRDSLNYMGNEIVSRLEEDLKDIFKRVS